MWCPAQTTFDEAEPGAVFVAARWHELFDEYTPDTFHPKLFNLSGLAAEATMIGELHEDHDAWMKHLKHVQAEIAERLEKGIEQSLCFPRQYRLLEKMSKATSATEVLGLGRILNLEDFQGHLESGVRRKFENFDLASAERKKKEADDIITCFATYAFRKGCGAEDIQSVEAELKQGSEGVRRWVLAALPEEQVEYDCILAIRQEDVDTEGAVRSVFTHLDVKRASPKIRGLPDEEGIIYFRGKSKGWRASDAIEGIRKGIRSSLNSLALYRQRAAPELLDQSWIVEGTGAREVPLRSPSFANLHPRRNADSLAKKAVEAIEERSEKDQVILAALDLHNVALSMTDHRLRLVNLWSALECLASLVEEGSIISRVVNIVCSILTWRKPEKVARYLAISIYHWLKANPEMKQMSRPFPVSLNYSVPAEYILALLSEPKDSEGIRSLLNLVSKHPLLLFRVHRAWEFFNNPAGLEAGLRASSKRLEWHLWRIYRARNLLVHKGVEPECLPQLSNHLQQYLSWTLSRLIHGLTFGECWTTRDSLNFWRAKSDHLMHSLIKHPELLTPADVFAEKVMNPETRIYAGAENSHGLTALS